MNEQASTTPAGAPAPAAAAAPRRAVLQVPRSALFGVVVGVVCTGPLVFAAPVALGWLPLLPLLAGVWVLRVRTVAGEHGFLARGVRRTRAVAWDDVDGVRFPRRGWGRAVLRDGREVSLPGVGFNDLRTLSAVSGGRVPDPFALAEAARVAALEPDPDGGASAEGGRAVEHEPDDEPGGDPDDHGEPGAGPRA